MAEVFVVRNQLGHYWGKRKKWVDGREPKAVQRAKYEDEAINTLFELGSGDFELRGEVLAVSLDERDEIVIEPSEHLIEEEPAPTPAAAESNAESGVEAAGETEESSPATEPGRTGDATTASP